MNKKMISLFLLMTLIISFASPVLGMHTDEIDRIILENNYVETDSNIYLNWDFPIKTNPVDWGDIEGKDAMVALLQIPEDILKEMCTKELVDVVLRYPFISDMLYYTPNITGVPYVAECFNGLRELMSRNDAPQYLMDAYKNSKNIILNAEIENELLREAREARNARMERRGTPIPENALEYIHTEDFRSVFPLKTITLILLSIEDTLDSYAATKSLSYSDYKEFFSREYENDPDLSPLEYMLGEYATIQPYSSGYVLTPTGVKVDVIYHNISMNNSQLKEYVEDVEKNYGETVLSRATWDYNCHTYAWYRQSTGNNAWMNNPSLYYRGSNPSYDNYDNVKRNDKIIWGSTSAPSHSAIVVSAGSTASRTIVESKWGEGCLVNHYADNSPYSSLKFSGYR